ncbi:MAG: class I SAM-dependent methyltransferase [Alphaproteobacteria bacterium]|nr:class I SAM-dependent methyltransferase [Alphaproteobacteria bacterium]
MSTLPRTKLIDATDFNHPELLPFLKAVAEVDGMAFGNGDMEFPADTTHWQDAMSLRVFDQFGLFELPGRLVAGIGAGMGDLAFQMASQGAVVVAADRYLDATPLSAYAPADMLVRPEGYSNRTYPRGGVMPLHADPRALALPSGFFDAVYAANVLEHLSSAEEVQAAAVEIGRVLKPGGIASISTEFLLQAPERATWSRGNWQLFSPELIESTIVTPSGLAFVDREYETQPSELTFAGKRILTDFAEQSRSFKDLKAARNLHPNLVMYHDGFLFCSIHITLQKLKTDKASAREDSDNEFLPDVTRNARRSARLVLETLREESRTAQPFPGYPPDPSEQLDQILASRSWRYTKPLRTVASSLRRNRLFGMVHRSMSRILRSFKSAR